MTRKHIDLNADMGEGYGSWTIGNDQALMQYLSSANIAGGFHAGDPHTIQRTIRLAKANGVGIGVHPGYRDPIGFGRRELAATAEEVRDEVLYQLGALREFARYNGLAVQHVKLHGALYMRAAREEELSRVIVEAIRKVGPELVIFCMKASKTYEVALELGQPVATEFYADRDYDDDGQIVFARSVDQPDAKAVALKVLHVVREGKVETISGRVIEIDFDTVCIHSDTPGAVEVAKAIRDELTAQGIKIRRVGEIIKNQEA
jgi:UPF0271 protein